MNAVHDDIEPTERQEHERQGGCPPESRCAVCYPESPDLCVTCHQPAAEGCKQCDRCMDEANRLWLNALHLSNVAREAHRQALAALREFNEANSTAPLSQRSQMRTV